MNSIKNKKNSSFEYKPLETEMMNRSDYSSNKNNSLCKLYDLQSEDKSDYSENVNDCNENDNSNTQIKTHRTRNSLASRTERNENSNEDKESVKYENIMHTPPKKNNNNNYYHNNSNDYNENNSNNNNNNIPQKICFYKDMFDTSESDNKKVMISELDIKVMSNKKEEQNKKKVKDKNSKNNEGIFLKKLYERNLKLSKQSKEKKNFIDTKNIRTNMKKCLTQRNKISNKIHPNLIQNKEINKPPLSQRKSENFKEYIKKNFQSGLLTSRANNKVKEIFTSIKRENSKLSFFNLAKKSSVKPNRANSNQSKQKLNSFSNRSSSLTTKINNINTKASSKYNYGRMHSQPCQNISKFHSSSKFSDNKPISNKTKFPYFNTESSKAFKQKKVLSHKIAHSTIPKWISKPKNQNSFNQKANAVPNINKETFKHLYLNIINNNNNKKDHTTNSFFMYYNQSNQGNNIPNDNPHFNNKINNMINNSYSHKVKKNSHYINTPNTSKTDILNIKTKNLNQIKTQNFFIYNHFSPSKNSLITRIYHPH